MFGQIHRKGPLRGLECDLSCGAPVGSGPPGLHPKMEPKNLLLFGPFRMPKREHFGAILGGKIGRKRRRDEVGRQKCDFSKKCVFPEREHDFEGHSRMGIDQKWLQDTLKRQLFRS